MGEAWIMFAIMVVGGGIGLAVLFAAFKWMDSTGAAPVVMLVLGQLMATIGGIWVLVIAFKESPLQGFLCLIVPFYVIFYIIANFDECTMPGILMLVGNTMSGVAMIMSAVTAG